MPLYCTDRSTGFFNSKTLINKTNAAHTDAGRIRVVISIIFLVTVLTNATLMTLCFGSSSAIVVKRFKQCCACLSSYLLYCKLFFNFLWNLLINIVEPLLSLITKGSTMKLVH